MKDVEEIAGTRFQMDWQMHTQTEEGHFYSHFQPKSVELFQRSLLFLHITYINHG